MKNIYVVEDDDNIRELIIYALNSSSSGDFHATGFTCAGELYSAVKTSLPDLFILDIMLPGEDGLSILKSLKRDGDLSAVPVIMLTAKSGEYDRIKGLDGGADDYIVKPFSVLELISRIKAVLRRAQAPKAEALLEAGTIKIDASRHIVTQNGKEIPLTLKEFELLTYLVGNKNLVLTRDKIMDKIWQCDFETQSRTVDMHIKMLRRKLGDDAIKTVRGVGYKIEG